MKEQIKAGVQQVVNDLYQEHGEVKPSALVDAARPEDSPAHAGFEWDDTVAGEQYRLQQSRHWIKRVKVTVENSDQALIHVPVVHAPADEDDDAPRSNEGVYKPIAVVAQNPDEYARARGELVGQVKAIGKTIKQLEKAAEKRERKEDARAISKAFKRFEHTVVSGRPPEVNP